MKYYLNLLPCLLIFGHIVADTDSVRVSPYSYKNAGINKNSSVEISLPSNYAAKRSPYDSGPNVKINALDTNANKNYFIHIDDTTTHDQEHERNHLNHSLKDKNGEGDNNNKLAKNSESGNTIVKNRPSDALKHKSDSGQMKMYKKVDEAGISIPSEMYRDNSPLPNLKEVLSLNMKKDDANRQINLDLQNFINQNKTAVVLIDLQKDFTKVYKGNLAVPAPGRDGKSLDKETDASYISDTIIATKFLKTILGLSVYQTLDSHPYNHFSFEAEHIGEWASNSNNVLEKITAEYTFPRFNIDLTTYRNRQNKPHLKRDHTVFTKDDTRHIPKLWSNRPNTIQGHHPKDYNPDGIQTFIPLDLIDMGFAKGTNPNYDSYSGVKDFDGAKTGLVYHLKESKIKNIIVYGLATDYCVLSTVEDLVAEGFNVLVISDLCRSLAGAAAPIEAMKDLKSNNGARVTVINTLFDD